MHDLVIKGGRVVDGTGAPARPADVAVAGGHVVEIGDVSDPARRVIEADGRVVSPGFIDVHTHLDVQGFWDPTLSPSPLHGVTTVVGGNCGFTVAPLDDDAAGYLMRMLARVEGMPLESLEKGVPWDWRSTAEYFDRLDGRLAVNAGFMIGHCALRRVVMNEAATEREATADELEAMRALLRDGLAAGGLGFSSTWSVTHNDAEGRPVPSRHATAEEVVALAGVCGEFEGTSIEFLPAVGRFDHDISELMIQMSSAAQRPLNWNLIAVTAASLPAWQDKLEIGTRARARGAKVVGLVLPAGAPIRLNFRSGFVLDVFPGWQEAMALPPADKLRMLSDPIERRRLDELAQQPGPFRDMLANWGDKIIVEAFTEDTRRHEGRYVRDIAREEGKEPFDALLDIVCADDLRTSFTPAPQPESAADWEARAQVWTDERAVIGASDAGAHLDMLATFNYATVLLEEGVRNHGLLSLEDAVRLLTDVPAQLYGLRQRGRLVEGALADIVVFDEATVGPRPVSTRIDLPGGAGRLYAEADGIGHVLVNGVEIAADGEFTEARPGTLLHSGRDTFTPALT